MNPASYCTGLDASRLAVSPFSLISTLSRRFAAVAPDSSLISPDEVDDRTLRAFFLRENQLTSGNLHGKRNEVLGVVEPEIIQLHDNREVRNRIAQHHRLFKMTLLVGRRVFAELLIGVIGLPIRKVCAAVLERRS